MHPIDYQGYYYQGYRSIQALAESTLGSKLLTPCNSRAGSEWCADVAAKVTTVAEPFGIAAPSGHHQHLRDVDLDLGPMLTEKLDACGLHLG